MTDGRRRLAGRYRLDGSLGQCGMSEVFHGYDERLDVDVVGRDYRRYLAPSDAFVLDSSYHAGHACAEIGEPDKFLPQLRFSVHHASAAGNEEADKVLGARFALAQMLAAAGRADDALAELESLRPLPAVTFGGELRSPSSGTTSTMLPMAPLRR